jgi:amino acid transporter
MERLIKIVFMVGFLLFFSLIYFEPLRNSPVQIYLGLVWLSVLIFILTGMASLFVLSGYIKRKDRKGALGVLSSILVFAILIGLLAAYMSIAIHRP